MSKQCLIICLNRGPGLGAAAAAAVNSAHSHWLAQSRGRQSQPKMERFTGSSSPLCVVLPSQEGQSSINL